MVPQSIAHGPRPLRQSRPQVAAQDRPRSGRKKVPQNSEKSCDPHDRSACTTILASAARSSERSGVPAPRDRDRNKPRLISASANGRWSTQRPARPMETLRHATQGSTNARDPRICSPWADIAPQLRCCRCAYRLQWLTTVPRLNAPARGQGGVARGYLTPLLALRVKTGYGYIAATAQVKPTRRWPRRRRQKNNIAGIKNSIPSGSGTALAAGRCPRS